MNCEEVRALIPDALTGEIAPAERAVFDGHLAICAACAEEIRRLSETWTRLGVLPAERPSPALSHRFYDMLEAERTRLAGASVSAPAGRRFRSAWSRFLAAPPAFRFAAALLFLAACLGAGFLAGSRGTTGGRLAVLDREVNDIRQVMARTLLERPSSADRLAGIGYSEKVVHPERGTLAALLDTLDNDPSVNVRLAAADALYLFAKDPAVKDGILASLGRQSSPIVQVALIDLLVDLRERRAVDAFRTLAGIQGLHPDVKSKAELGIRQLSF